MAKRILFNYFLDPGKGSMHSCGFIYLCISVSKKLSKNDLFEYQHRFFIASLLRRNHFIICTNGNFGFI